MMDVQENILKRIYSIHQNIQKIIAGHQSPPDSYLQSVLSRLSELQQTVADHWPLTEEEKERLTLYQFSAADGDWLRIESRVDKEILALFEMIRK